MVNQDNQRKQLNELAEGDLSSFIKLIDQLKQLTLNIVARLAETTHDEMLEFIGARDKVINELQQLEQTQQNSSLTSAFANEIKEILSHDNAILARLAELQTDISEKINKSSAARKQRSAYDAVYALDSVYFDKKK